MQDWINSFLVLALPTSKSNLNCCPSFPSRIRPPSRAPPPPTPMLEVGDQRGQRGQREVLFVEEDKSNTADYSSVLRTLCGVDLLLLQHLLLLLMHPPARVQPSQTRVLAYGQGLAPCGLRNSCPDREAQQALSIPTEPQLLLAFHKAPVKQRVMWSAACLFRTCL